MRSLRTAALLSLCAAASFAAAQQQDWSAPSADSRYASPAGGAAGPPAEPRYGQPAQPVAPPTPDQSITPLPGSTPPATGSAPSGQAMAPFGGSAPSRARVSKGPSSLPNDHGQVMREYDIRPYTLKVANTPHPEQTIVDWILRETGYETWHSDPLGILNATRDTLRVYHTPETQGVVADIVDRFVNTQSESKAFALRIATVRSPGWRARAMPLMTAIPVQSPGMQGWILPKENAALLMADLVRRTDYREHSSSGQLVLNGRSAIMSTMRPRQYIKGIVRTQNTWPGFQPETGTLEEGASMEFSPLLSFDGATADAIVKIRINQVEKMQQVQLDIPTQMAGPQRMEIEVPQLTSATIHERFRWPSDQVLLLSLGVVAPPTPDKGNQLLNLIPGVNAPPRADGLLFIEVKGTATPSSNPGSVPSTAMRSTGGFSGRY
ncbi:hypothetical protein Pla123a_41220 [Posidoniimonas polymericola]|uniref:Bacterial type II and III secretion system protein n=1 Tax=Posidoniimonas polymericola TaxID=2528002 RepID=A0A5C5YHF6_9BACT|nr:hypothetical protein [Posidoniimonas polymericola]TWT72822.1 hypothetical protein Pla123a_41220 [Posidoniimonas polymericola]